MPLTFDTPSRNTLLILSQDAAAYESLVREAKLPQLSIAAFNTVEDAKSQAKAANILFGDPDLLQKILPEMAGLEWAQSTWAGVTPLTSHGCRKDYILTGVKGIFGPMMAEYVMGYLLAHERSLLSRYNNQLKRLWDKRKPGQLKGKTIGIMGVGDIGTTIAKRASQFGMKCFGYARHISPNGLFESPSYHLTPWPPLHKWRGEIDEGFHGSLYPSGHGALFDRIFGSDQLMEFVKGVDYLVSILPDTPATTHLLNASLFKAMKPEALFINVGRGNVVDEMALVTALRQKEIAGAVLDVFQEEPLPREHPFWETPGVIITSHTAALSFPEDIAPIFIENYRGFVAHARLNFQVDFDKGY